MEVLALAVKAINDVKVQITLPEGRFSRNVEIFRRYGNTNKSSKPRIAKLKRSMTIHEDWIEQDGSNTLKPPSCATFFKIVKRRKGQGLRINYNSTAHFCEQLNKARHWYEQHNNRNYDAPLRKLEGEVDFFDNQRPWVQNEVCVLCYVRCVCMCVCVVFMFASI